MMLKRLMMGLIMLTLGATLSCAQSKEEYALSGITHIDMGHYKEGISDLRKARNLDPSDYELTLELGRAFMLWDKPRKAQEYFNLLLEHSQRTAELFVLLSRCSNSNLKENTLNRGLAVFPYSGKLHAEMGGVLAAYDKLDEAIAYWEKGIEVDPEYADNYLFASRIYLVNDELFWGWLYGETYLNLKHDDQVDPAFVLEVRNALRRAVTLAAVSKPKDELGALIYLAADTCDTKDKPKDLAKLSKRLTCLVDRFTEIDRSPYQVPLFDHYAMLAERQLLEVYLFWVYGRSDDPEMTVWLESNAKIFEEFSQWMYWNGLRLGEENRFVKLK